MIKAANLENLMKGTENKEESKKQEYEKRVNSWREKPLHGQFIKGIEGKSNNSLSWAWLRTGTIKKETEGLLQSFVRSGSANKCNEDKNTKH